MSAEKLPTGRMIRAARGLANLNQTELGDLIGVNRRTIDRVETDDPPLTGPRRTETCTKIRDMLEGNYEIRFIYPDKHTGEGVAMKKSK